VPDAQGMPTPGEAAHALAQRGEGPWGRRTPGPQSRWGCLATLLIGIAIACVGALINGPTTTEELPTQFFGTWEGKVRESPSKKSYRVTVTLGPGEEHDAVGKLSYRKPSCEANLFLRKGEKVGQAMIPVRELGCFDGVIDLHLFRGVLRFEGSDGRSTLVGVLRKK